MSLNFSKALIQFKAQEHKMQKKTLNLQSRFYPNVLVHKLIIFLEKETVRYFAIMWEIALITTELE